MDSKDLDRTQLGPVPGLEEALGSHAETRTGSLTVIQGKGADLGKHLVLESRTVIGRASDCSLTIGDFQASRRHCEICCQEDGSYVIKDLGSTNGTRVAGQGVEGSLTLRDGDKVFVGETVLRFILADDLDLEFAGQVGHLLRTDPLTGLQSKRSFDHALEFALTDAARQDRSVAVLMMDLDGIKGINDTHGHLFGAYSIQQAGRLIARVLEGRGRACRFGGDEFTAFLPDVDRDAGARIAEEIRFGFQEAGLEKDGIPLKPTISIGVTAFPEDGTDLTSLIAAADEALYRAKADGKNLVRSYGTRS
jgi:diguanylate cyclase (GGDEF)-like protein